MAEQYGLTIMGPNPKRLDVIEDEIHTKLSEKWGVNTRANPESFLCHLIRNIADQLADLWAYGNDVYYSQFPNSAEDVNLDTAVQYGGIVREAARKSIYRILCTGVEGTVIPEGTKIASSTNSKVMLQLPENTTLTREKFNTVKIRFAYPDGEEDVRWEINGFWAVYGRRAGDIVRTDEDMIRAIVNYTNRDFEGFSAELDPDNPGIAIIRANDAISENTLILSDNLTTETVGNVVLFETLDDGDIFLPEGTITQIVRAVVGLHSVTNVGPYTAGQLRETDTQLRQSYVDKIYKRSSAMVESIRSNILDQIPEVESCAVYENDTNETDAFGRPPHSVEVVADGTFEPTELAQVILNTKAGGIATFGSEEVIIPGNYGEPIPIYFNYPQKIFVFFRIGVKFNEAMNVPTNYEDLTQEVILDYFDKLKAGDDVSPQKFLQSLYETVPGVDYFTIEMGHTDDESQTPSLTDNFVEITPRQKAVTDESKISVVTING